MPYIDFDRVHREIRLLDVVEAMFHPLIERRGPKARGACPAKCCDQARCVSFDFQRGAWFCHKCQRMGGAIDFFRTTTNQSVYDGTVSLYRLLGKDLPLRPATYDQLRKRKGSTRQRVDAEPNREL